jgi:NADPH:quinone reductase-like Zn-dependent oxidoreductase
MQQTAVSTTMKALIIDDYGPPQNARFGDIVTPKVKDGYLLVHMRAASVNPFDYKIVTGQVKDWIHITFPYVPGMDGAGVIADIGNGVQDWRKGDAVVGMFPRGAFAQFALISGKDKKLARKPDALDFEHAAALPQTSLTATTMLRAGNVGEGQTVLIIGATGGVGLFATQLAKARGARVIATGKTQDVDYLRQLGADDVIDYGQGDTLTQTRERYPAGVDVVLDVINSGDAILRDAQVIRDGGTLLSSLSGPPQEAFGRGITVQYIQNNPQAGDLDDIVKRAADGKLHVEIGCTYDLSDAAQALADLTDPTKHTRGKFVIRID